MSFNSADIKNMVEKMNESKVLHQHLKETNKDEYVKRVSEDCPILFKDYDAIFKMNIEDRLDETFMFMLGQLRKREIGRVSKAGVENNIINHLGKRSRDSEGAPEDEPQSKQLSYADFVKTLPE
jgi:hypothetical protein